jgi:hypothetical protein
MGGFLGNGLVEGAVDGGQAIVIVGMNIGPNADTAKRLLEAAIATVKRR